MFQTFTKSLGNPLATHFPTHVKSDGQARQLGERTVFQRRILIIVGNFDGAYGSRNGVDIGRVVQVLIRGKQLRQFLQTLVGKGLTQLRILRNRTQTVAAQNALKIKSGTSTHHDFFSTRTNVVICLEKVALVFKQIVFRSWLNDINEMEGDFFAVDFILFEVFPRTEIHAPIHLPTVGTDYFSVNQ